MEVQFLYRLSARYVDAYLRASRRLFPSAIRQSKSFLSESRRVQEGLLIDGTTADEQEPLPRIEFVDSAELWLRLERLQVGCGGIRTVKEPDFTSELSASSATPRLEQRLK